MESSSLSFVRRFACFDCLLLSPSPPEPRGDDGAGKKGCKQEELEFIALSPRVKWPSGNAETDQNARADCLPLLVFLVV